MKKAVLALSGGMDSTSLLLHLLHNNYEVKCYSFSYGQKHKVELERAQKNVEYFRSEGYPILKYQLIDLSSVFNESGSALISSDVKVPEGHYVEPSMTKTVIENRNAIFAACLYAKALAWANEEKEDVQICLGIHAGDHSVYPDCRKESRDTLAEAFRISNWGSERINYYTPFLDINKFHILSEAEIICDIESLDFNQIFSNTNTCYQPDEDGRACGKCGSCVERVEAFIYLKRTDPVKYIKEWLEIVDSVLKILNEK